MSHPPDRASEGAFPPGTRIATLSASGVMGEAAVESLRPGDTVLTLLGPAEQPTPIRAIHRVAAAQGPLVHIRAGALAPAMPSADLVLPATALLRLRESLPPDVPIGEGEDPGALVPAAALLNSTSIYRDAAAAVAEWHVIELDSHSILLANATATASACHYPRCLPILPAGPALNYHRQRLAARAMAEEMPEMAPPQAAFAAKPVLPPVTLLTAGKPVPLEEPSPWHFTCTLPPRSGPVRLRSTRRRADDDSDGRRFGVCVRAAAVNGVPLVLDSASFGPGFHPIEGSGEDTWRWTTGDAWLVLPYSAEARTLALTLTDWHEGLREA